MALAIALVLLVVGTVAFHCRMHGEKGSIVVTQ